ncbi:hypothetical protein [Paenibacillus dendrobii]|nr:hypothetical protein [Paenibacillus dendrobii]
MLSYSAIDIPDGAVYEHNDNQITYAAIQDGLVRVTAIGAYGQIKPVASFSGQKLNYISSFHGTDDHGFLIAGGNAIMKLNDSGKPEWEYTTSSSDPAGLIRSAVQLKDHSYMAAVTSPAEQPNTSMLRLIHFTASGKVFRSQELPGAVFDNVDTLTPLSDGGFAVSAESVTETGTEQIFIAKWDAALNLIWQNKYDPAEDTENLWITALSEGSSGNLALAGYYNHPNPDGSYRYLTSGYVMGISQEGSLQWIHQPDPSLDRSMLNDIQPAPDGGFMATGTVNQDWHGTVSKQLVWKLSSDGNTEWNKVINRTTFNSGLLVQPLRISGQKDTALLIGTADGSPVLIKIGYLKNP